MLYRYDDLDSIMETITEDNIQSIYDKIIGFFADNRDRNDWIFVTLTEIGYVRFGRPINFNPNYISIILETSMNAQCIRTLSSISTKNTILEEEIVISMSEKLNSNKRISLISRNQHDKVYIGNAFIAIYNHHDVVKLIYNDSDEAKSEVNEFFKKIGDMYKVIE